MQVDEEHGMAGLCEHRRHVRRQRRRPDAALGADEREHFPARHRRDARHARDGRFELFAIERLGDTLADPGAHRFEHQLRFEPGHDDNPRPRMRAAKGAQVLNELRPLADVDEQHLRHAGGRVRERTDHRLGDQRVGTAELAHDLFEIGLAGRHDHERSSERGHLCLQLLSNERDGEQGGRIRPGSTGNTAVVS